VHKIIDHEPVQIWGDGSVVRDYIYIDDLINACLGAVVYDGPSRVFNVGTGKGHALLELIAAIESITGEKADVHFLGRRHADVAINILDVSRARNELSWHPAVSLQTGLRLLLEKTMESPAAFSAGRSG
jgi:UDP-glucose 4-epimerase